MALMNQKILVVGGGIAGCSAGIALAAAGHNVRIVEAQAEWRFQSSGIFVYCNGLACLADLGVLPEILATGYSVAQGRNAYYDHTGAEITQTFYPTDGGGFCGGEIARKYPAQQDDRHHHRQKPLAEGLFDF